MSETFDRREFLKALSFGAAAMALPRTLLPEDTNMDRPNIILCMTDDQGWGDTGYNGHPVLKTPHLDAMAAKGLRFDRFYAGAPVCSPTRGSALTGRHPYRYGIFFANVGHLRREEVTLAEALRTQGYATGHFGKWHLGTLTTKIRDANRGGKPGMEKHYAPPWENGFDVCFSTESKVPTWNPMVTPERSAGGVGKRKLGSEYGTYYWTGPDQRETENLEGDDSRTIMDRAIPFIRNAAKAEKPFLAVVWFHTPHLPALAGPEHRKLYADRSEDEQHYYGCISAMDEQVGRLRKELRDLDVAGNTMLWFCSDNGPEGAKRRGRNQGSAGSFRGRKRSLFEGGVRVPGLLEWPAEIKEARAVEMPCSTSDYFPTVMAALGFKMKGQPEPMDGVSLLPLIEGKMTARPRPLGFESRSQLSLTDNRYKLISQDRGKTYALHDLVEDPSESTDLASQKPEVVATMRKTLDEWRASCKRSLEGQDYR